MTTAVSYTVREIASRLKFMACTGVVAWDAMYSGHARPDMREVVMRDTALKLAREAGDSIVRDPSQADKLWTDEPHGPEFRLRTYFFSRDQLLRLLDEVYAEGHKEGRLSSSEVRLA